MTVTVTGVAHREIRDVTILVDVNLLGTVRHRTRLETILHTLIRLTRLLRPRHITRAVVVDNIIYASRRAVVLHR